MYSSFKNSLIVSCQAEEGEPLHGPIHMQKMAIAAVQSGAKGIRANSPIDIRAIKQVVNVPVIGLMKDRNPEYSAFITTTYKQIDDLAAAGSDLIAIDSTRVSRPVPLKELYQYIKSHYPKIGTVADIADIEDAKMVAVLNPDFISTTLSGYTDYSVQRTNPDLDLIDKIRHITNIPIIAEGHYNNPEQIRQAILCGAYTAIVGGAITRPQQITKRFVEIISDFHDEIFSIGIDIGASQTRGLLTDQFGKIIDSIIIETPKKACLIIKKVAEIIKNFSSGLKPVTSLGIATAGRCDEKTGVIRYATKNIENWSGMEIGKRIYESTGIFPIVNNDANLAAYGQWKQSKESSLTLMTIGTGIGAGIIIDGKIVQGAFGGAAEVGHITIPGNQNLCTCSKRGCIETVASARALKVMLDSNLQSEKEIMDKFLSEITWLIDTIQRVVEVERFYISGSIINYGAFVTEEINKRLQDIDSLYKEDFVSFSHLGELAGAIGASLYALDNPRKPIKAMDLCKD